MERILSYKLALYRWAMGMGIQSNGVLGSGSHSMASVTVWDLMYYMYKKGFWSMVRGTFYRPRLKRSKGRFFLGRQTNILFPKHLSVGRNVAIGDYVFMNCFGLNGTRLGDNVRIPRGHCLRSPARTSLPRILRGLLN